MDWTDLSGDKVLVMNILGAPSRRGIICHQFLISAISKDNVSPRKANNSQSIGSPTRPFRVALSRFSWLRRRGPSTRLFKSIANRRGGNSVLSIILCFLDLATGHSQLIRSPRDFPRIVLGGPRVTRPINMFSLAKNNKRTNLGSFLHHVNRSFEFRRS